MYCKLLKQTSLLPVAEVYSDTDICLLGLQINSRIEPIHVPDRLPILMYLSIKVKV